MIAATPLQFSFDAALHRYTDESGMVIPSVTQCLKSEGFINFDGIAPNVLERKRRLGCLVHEAAAILDREGSLSGYDIPAVVDDYLQGYINFRSDCEFRPRLVEERSLAVLNGMRYGMCLDREGMLNGYPYVLELKCGAAEHPAWGLQLAAYDAGQPLLGQRRNRVALQLGPQFTRGYKVYGYEDPADYQVWLNCLANTIWKQNKKLFVADDIPERVAA